MSDDEEFARTLRSRADAAVPPIVVDTAVVVPRARRRRAVTRTVGALAVVALVAGGVLGAASLFSGRGTTTPPAETPTATSAPFEVVPTSVEQRLGLIGMWRVTAEGESADTWLRLSSGEFIAFRDCGKVQGAWAVGPTTLVASVSMWNEGCSEASGVPALPWLVDATTYRADGDGWQLLDESGAVLAALRQDGLPTPDDTMVAELFEAPVADDAARYWVGDPAAVPGGLTAATAASVEGRWVSPGSPVANDPYVDLVADGTWQGSDGCNSSGGRWAMDLDGRFLVTSGGHTEIGCDGAPLPDLLATGRRLALDGATLVVLDQDGAEVMRLAREGEPVVTPAPGGTSAPAAGAEGPQVTATCTDTGLALSATTVAAASDGVRLVVGTTSAQSSAATYLAYRWDDGWSIAAVPLTATPTEVVLPVQPGGMDLMCSDGSQFQVEFVPGATLTVVDPEGYWQPTTPQDLKCAPGGVLDMAVPPEAVGRATAREAVEGLANGVGLGGIVTVVPVPVGYVDAETPTWLVYRDGIPYMTAAVTVADGAYSASGEVMCAAL